MKIRNKKLDGIFKQLPTKKIEELKRVQPLQLDEESLSELLKDILDKQGKTIDPSAAVHMGVGAREEFDKAMKEELGNHLEEINELVKKIPLKQ
jgi:hypothetical protein